MLQIASEPDMLPVQGVVAGGMDMDVKWNF